MRTDLAVVAIFASLLTPAAAQRGPCRDKIVCVDGVNNCGVAYSGCYNTCFPQDSPTPAPCKTTSTTSAKPTTTKTNCKTKTVCVEGVNSCGVKFATCIPDCTPWVISTPPCTSTTTSKPTSTTVTMATTTSVCAPVTVCEDYIDLCGQMYGGCYNTCKPKPTWTKPPCTPTITSKPTMTTVTKTTTTSKCIPGTICEDYIDPCGQTYGGCYDSCKPKPTWTKPPCKEYDAVPTADY